MKMKNYLLNIFIHLGQSLAWTCTEQMFRYNSLKLHATFRPLEMHCPLPLVNAVVLYEAANQAVSQPGGTDGKMLLGKSCVWVSLL